MISHFKPAYSTQALPSHNREPRHGAGRQPVTSHASIGIEGPYSFNRASDADAFFGSLWDPSVLDGLRTPLTRYHE